MPEIYKEKLFDPPGQMDFVHALTTLHTLKNLCNELHIDDVAEALDVVFCWIDDMSLLVNQIAADHIGDQKGGVLYETDTKN